MDREVNMWGRIVSAIWAPDRVLNRIENGVLDGMPDAYYAIEAQMGWMELKAPIEPKREGTALFSGNHKLSQSQRNWLLAHRQAGGVGWVAIETESHFMLIGARHSDIINTANLAQLRAMADFTRVRPLKARDWEIFKWTLCHPTEASKGLP